jgi:hypothetical protein
LSRRLNSIHRSSEISAWGSSVSDTVLRTEDTLNRMCHAISETIHKVKEFGDLPGAPSAPAALLEGLQMLMSSTKDHRDKLRLVGRNLKEAEPPILLRGLLKSFRVHPLVLSLRWQMSMIQWPLPKATSPSPRTPFLNGHRASHSLDLSSHLSETGWRLRF